MIYYTWTTRHANIIKLYLQFVQRAYPQVQRGENHLVDIVIDGKLYYIGCYLGCEVVYWILLTQDSEGTIKGGEFRRRLTTVSFSRRALCSLRVSVCVFSAKNENKTPGIYGMSKSESEIEYPNRTAALD